jgi:hypothetical protein
MNEMTYPQAQFLLTVHYQLHCPVRIGAWEGCHRVYTAATLVEALKPSPYYPVCLGMLWMMLGSSTKTVLF